MENILLMVERPKPTEITSIEQTDQETMQEFFAKTSVWDFYEITREEYMNKGDDDKKSLIVKFFNYMTSGKILLFVSLLRGVCSLFFMSEVCIVFSSMIRFSPVSSLSVKFCSVSVVLPDIDSLSQL